MKRLAVIASLVLGSLALTSVEGSAFDVTPVPAANPRITGVVMPNVLSPELAELVRARGAMALENPVSPAKYYGYDDDHPNMMPALGSNVEARKTEPDKNTYLVLEGQPGADPNYNYGRHFLFQGHEAGPGYITRINLDADVAHRVTLLATTDVHGTPLPTFDGSTWYPWSQRLLFTSERGNQGGVWQASLDVPSAVEDVSGVFGRAGYEGIQADMDGTIWLVEDVGGRTGTINTHALQPNSFVYRLIPYVKNDLRVGGKLQVLAVKSKAHAGNIVFNNASADVDILSQDVADLHTHGNVFDTTWITIHDTATDGTAPFDANALAKGVGTPFKRPENGVFRPGTAFREFFFTETGDTNSLTEAGTAFGGFGGGFKLTQRRPSDMTGTLRLFFLGDLQHTGFDNIAFWSKNRLAVTEDRGDRLHGQANALDSAWLLDTSADYGTPANQPVRFLAQGRDPSATIDAALVGTTGFLNDGDNEITGIHISDGDPTPGGLLGVRAPNPLYGHWRVFYTQQHGDNTTFEIIRNPNVNARDIDKDSNQD